MSDPILIPEPLTQKLAEDQCDNPKIAAFVKELVRQELSIVGDGDRPLPVWVGAKDVAKLFSVSSDHVRKIRSTAKWVEGAEFVKSGSKRPTFHYRLSLVRHWESVRFFPNAQMLQSAARKKLADEDRRKLRSAERVLRRSSKPAKAA
ncbi:MAG: hypothetical protein ACFCA4_19250 [Cyanophyceae cyanobacterium]|mgnify:CR=1 FL=1